MDKKELIRLHDKVKEKSELLQKLTDKLSASALTETGIDNDTLTQMDSVRKEWNVATKEYIQAIKDYSVGSR